MDKKEAEIEIKKKTDEAIKLLRECEVLADNHDVSFGFKPAYGMGGRYRSRNRDKIDEEFDEYDNRLGWLASSHSC